MEVLTIAHLISRTRIELFLPCTKSGEIVASQKAIERMRRRSRLIKRWGGITHTAKNPPVFLGYYWSQTRNMWIPDKIQWVFIDAEIDIETARLTRWLQALHKVIAGLYAAEDSNQEEFWITTYNVSVFTL